ncbi:MAG: ATP-binding protein [Verrucomicrobiota bacterium]
MSEDIGFDLSFPSHYLKAAIAVSLLSVWVLVGLFFYLNHYTKRKYFTIWASGWLFYALWLTLNLSLPGARETGLVLMLKLACISTVAIFLFWGSARFLGQKVRESVLWLFMGFLYTWSYYGAYNLEDPIQARLPIFGLIGLASFRTAWCFWLYRRNRQFIGAGLLATGFVLWGFFHIGYPFLQLIPDLSGAGFFVSTVLQLYIAVSMIVLVLEEARHLHHLAFRNLSNQSDATTKLRHQMHLTEEKYRSLFEQASEAIIITTADTLHILGLNVAAARLLGVAQAAASQIRLTDFFQPTDAKRAPGSGEEWHQHIVRQRPLVLVRKDGTSTPVEANGAKVDLDGKPAFQFFVRPLTEKEQLENQLRQAEKLSAIGQMISGIAHELNNPLAVIQGYIELVLSHHNLPAGTRTDLEKVAQESQRAARLVKNFLALARERPPQREPVCINELINKVIDLRKIAIQIAAVETVMDLQEPLPETVADPDQIQQVLVILINNALQAMTEKEQPGKLHLRTRAQNGMLLISVRDTGPGVPPQSEHKIFEPFYTTKSVGTGTGLGLSIAHTILTDHKGRIYHQRPADGGACFVLELPVVQPVPVEAAKPKEIKESVVQPQVISSKPLAWILVLDDEKMIAELLAEMLQLLGYKTTVCHAGGQALEFIAQNEYDLILSDMRMPGMDGKAFYERVKSAKPDLAERIVFLTGDMVNEETRAFLDSIGNLSVGKPFKLANVKEAVETVLADVTAKTS